MFGGDWRPSPKQNKMQTTPNQTLAPVRLPLRSIRNGDRIQLFSRSGEKVAAPFTAKIVETFNGSFYERHLLMPDRVALPIYSDSKETFEIV